MNWEQIEGQWKQFKGNIKGAWAKLTDDDIELLNGKRDVLIGKLQERYGIVKEDANRQVDAWLETQGATSPGVRPHPKVQ